MVSRNSRIALATAMSQRAGSMKLSEKDGHIAAPLTTWFFYDLASAQFLVRALNFSMVRPSLNI